MFSHALILTPHSSGFAPLEVLFEMLGEQVFDQSARKERLEFLFAEGDPFTDLLFHTPGAHQLHALTSRFVVDLNRPRDLGGDNGVIKPTDFQRNPLYPPGFTLTEGAREQRLRRYWDPFHAEVDRLLENPEIRLLVDGHSMQALGPAIGPDGGEVRPALCLMTGHDGAGNERPGARGTVSSSQARALHTLLEHHFADWINRSSPASKEIALNAPWSGDDTSLRYSDPARVRHIPAFGLEFNRALYLENPTGAVPLEKNILELNALFQNFLKDALELF